MKRHIAVWLGAVLGMGFALLVNAHGQTSDTVGQLTEEFHHSYPLSSSGRIALENINGPVHITGIVTK